MRFRNFALVLALVGLAGLSRPAFADEARDQLVLEPSSRWNAVLDNGRCRLGRVFGQGDNRHILFFEQEGPWHEFGITVAGPGFSAFADFADTKLRYFDGQGSIETRPSKGEVADYGPSLTTVSGRIKPFEKSDEEDDEPEDGDAVETGLAQLDTGYAAQTSYVAIRQGEREVLFKTGSLSAPFTVLNDCSGQLLTNWGLDLQAHKTASKRVVLKNIDEIADRMSANWNIDAIRKGRGGSVLVRVLVSKEGEMGECIAIYQASSDLMDESSCNSMARSRFEPALDAEGKPMDSYYINRISYRAR